MTGGKVNNDGLRTGQKANRRQQAAVAQIPAPERQHVLEVLPVLVTLTAEGAGALVARLVVHGPLSEKDKADRAVLILGAT